MMNRSRLLLLLVCLLVLAIWYAWQQSPRQERVRPNAVSKSDIAAAKVAVKEFEKLDFSGGKTNKFRKPKRDLFRPLYAAPPVSKARPKPTPVVVAPPPPPKPKPTPKPVVTPVVRTKPIQPLTVLGFLEKNHVKTVFLASRQGEIFLVKKGDRFADGLLVRELTDTEIQISRDAQESGVTLKIGDKKNQRMANLNLPSDRPRVPDYPGPEETEKKPAAIPGEN